MSPPASRHPTRMPGRKATGFPKPRAERISRRTPAIPMTGLGAWADLPFFSGDWPSLERRIAEDPRRILPPEPHRFAALAHTQPDATRVVILGQDPYPTPGHANGLAAQVAEEHLPRTRRRHRGHASDRRSHPLGRPGRNSPEHLADRPRRHGRRPRRARLAKTDRTGPRPPLRHAPRLSPLGQSRAGHAPARHRRRPSLHRDPASLAALRLARLLRLAPVQPGEPLARRPRRTADPLGLNNSTKIVLPLGQNTSGCGAEPHEASRPTRAIHFADTPPTLRRQCFSPATQHAIQPP